MEVFEAVRTMLAVREFQDKPVPPESVRRIVEAGRLSGGSMNRQPWHFIVVRESLRFKVENLETFKQDVALLAKADPRMVRIQVAQSRSRIQRRARLAA